MPTFVSKRGQWSPAKEEIGLQNLSEEVIENDCIFGTKKEGIAQPGEHFIYRGPDREALKQLHLESVEHLGRDFKTDPDFLQATRNMGYNNVDEYLKAVGYDEKKEEEEFSKKASTVKAHEIKERVNAIKVLAGGNAPNKEEAVVGGFGDQKQTPAVNKK